MLPSTELRERAAPVEPGHRRAITAFFPPLAGGILSAAVRKVPPAAAFAPAVIFIAVRGLGLLVLAAMADARGVPLGPELRSWDGEWLLGLAGGGYGNLPAGLVDAHARRDGFTGFAFFPGYPAMVGAVRILTGFDLLNAGLIVSVLAGIVAAYGLVRLVSLIPDGSRRAGLALVALFAAAPMGVVLSMTYSETLFCALAVWTLVWLLERRWIAAGFACAGAGLVRPTGGALVLAALVAVVVAVLARRSVPGAEGWRPWLGVLLAPTGLLGYLAYVAVQTGAVGGWFAVQQRGWNSRFDAGAATLSFSLDVLASGRSVLELVTVVVLLGAIVLLGVSIVQRLPLPVLAYGAAVLAMDIGSNGLMSSKARLLLPAFTLLLPIAIGLARRQRTTMVAVLVGAAIASAWFGGYALTGWHYAI